MCIQRCPGPSSSRTENGEPEVVVADARGEPAEEENPEHDITSAAAHGVNEQTAMDEPH